MAAREQLILDILANDRASGSLRNVGRSASAASDDVGGLARRLDEIDRKSVDARVALQGDKESLAQLDRLDLKMRLLSDRVMSPKISIDGAARAAVELAALDVEFDKLGRKAERAAGAGGRSGLGALIGSAGAGGQGMTGLVAAGVALSPVLVTVGTGLGGLAAAAYGVAKPIENAAQKTGGLQANLKTLDPLERQVAVGILGLGKQYDAFQKALKPEVIGIFNQGLRIAGHLMKDVEPVAAATGKALGRVLGQIDAEFQSGTWQQFFGFMARTAGPDVKLLGNLFVTLAHALPPLLEALQPVAVELIKTTTGIASLVGAVGTALSKFEALSARERELAKTTHDSSGAFAFLEHAALTAFNEMVPGAHSVALLKNQLDKSGTAAGASGKQLFVMHLRALAAAGSAGMLAGKMRAQGTAEKAADAQLQHLISTVDTYISRTSSMLGVTNSVITDIRQMAKDSRAAGASFTGLNANSITLQNDLSQNLIPTVQTVIKRMQGAGASSHDLARVLSSDLKPAVDAGALANKDLRDEIFAMAREAGYAGPNKIAPLSRFIDRNAGSLRGARNDANSYTRALKGIPSDINTHIKVTAQAQIAISTGTQRQIPGKRAAKGMLITAGTTPTADDVLIRASRGELVVPADMVRGGAVDHLKGSIPGFAAGGMVGSYAGSLPGLTKWIRSEDKTIARAIAAAVEKGVRSALASAAGGYASLHGIPGGAGVARWTGLVREALAMEGLSKYLTGNVLYQMQTESGGNPRAINLTDINAQHGDPSRGLMQVIMSTFRAYHWPGTSWNIYDPLANIAAALNYARHRYGPALESGGMGIGSGHGYALGTSSAAPGWGWVGEEGPELLRFRGGEQVVPAGLEQMIPAGRREGPLVYVENQYVHDPVDVPKIASQLSFKVIAASMG